MKNHNKTKEELFSELQELQQAYNSLEISFEKNLKEQKTREETLLINEERYRGLLNNLDAGIVVHAPDTSIIMNNPRASFLLGLTDDQMRGKEAIDEAWNFVNEDFTPLLLDGYPVNRIVTGKKQIKNQILGIRQPGKNDIVWVNVNGFPVIDNKGEITEIVISFIDFTEQKKAEDALKVNERLKSELSQKLNESQHIAMIGSWEWNLRTNEVWWSDETYLIFGVTSQDFTPGFEANGKFMHPDDLENYNKSFAHSLNTGESLDEIFRLITPSGILKYINGKGKMIFDEAGLPVRFIGTVMDITARREFELLLQEKTKEIEAQNEEYQQLNEELYQINKELTQAIGRIEESEKLLAKIAENFPNSYVSIIEKDLTVGFSGGQEFKRQNLNPNDFIGLTIEQVFGEFSGIVKENYLKTFDGNETSFELFINNQHQHYKTVPLFDEKNQITRILSVVENITERKLAEKALRESETRFKNMFERHNAIMLLIEPESGFIIDANEASVKFYGYSKPELLAMRIDEINILTHEQVKIERTQAANEERNYFVFPHRLASGEVRTVEVHSSPIVFQDHHILFSIIHDITDRKKAEEAIIDSEARFRNIFENSMIGNALTYLDGTFKTNRAFCEIVGYSEEELIKMKWQAITHPDDVLHDTVVFDSILSGAKSYEKWEKRYIKKSGAMVWVDISTTLQRDQHGKPLYFITSINDITERKLAEDKLKESELKYRSLIENSSDAIFCVDEKGEYKFTNSLFASTFGKTPEYFIGKTFWDIYDKEHADHRYNATKRLFQTGQSESIEVEVPLPDKTLYFLAKTNPIKDKSGKVILNLTHATDITTLKKVERELQKAKELAEESDRLKSAFLANMSHEIRTPMNGILGFAELLKEPNLTGEEQKQYVNIIGKSGMRMLNIINDIIDISKIEAGLIKAEIKESNINEQIEFIFAFFKPEVETKGIKFSFRNSLPARDAIIFTDREKLYAILTNLVKNAIKYTNEGAIEFGYTFNLFGETGEPNRTHVLQFYVKDTGIGIPKNRQEAIFERFVQADIEDKKAMQGAGLGLTITKTYVEMLGGKIWVESEEGSGSTFYFTLPYSPKQNREITIENDAIASHDANIQNLKILIAEDDEDSNSLITISVKKISREIIRVGTGIEAVEVCRNNTDIDLVLMDLRMPAMSGYEATRLIRQFNKDIVIIAQTAYGLSGDREKAIDAGCNDYISKPIYKNELLALIKKYFRQ